jgi:signal transduction histidine kinase
VSRLPIRIRVTVAFAGAMAVILIALGLFVYLRLEARLNETIDDTLGNRAGEVSAFARGEFEGPGLSGTGPQIEQEDNFAQILTPGGRVLDSTPQVGDRPVLSPAELERTVQRRTFVGRDQLPGLDPPVRLLGAPFESPRGTRIVVVGSSLEDRDDTLRSLRTQLLIGGPVALLLASLAGYWAAGRALRPVDAMRRRAAEISSGGPDERLPVPRARDELSRLGETLNEMLGRLDAALERERRFVDDASHELRTPLALHKAELELALRYGSKPEELRGSIASAIEEIDRLIQLAEDLLVVARSEKGRLALTSERLRVDDLFATVSERFRARALQAERPLVLSSADGVVVEGDRLRIEQALTSMVDNALRHGDGEIRIWARADDRRVELHVSDGGPGFPPGFTDHAFERFSRADAARGRGGAGLGLAIVDTIARAHGGRARAANGPGGGADVWIEVPPAQPEVGSAGD